jgi:hypothetical protein
MFVTQLVTATHVTTCGTKMDQMLPFGNCPDVTNMDQIGNESYPFVKYVVALVPCVQLPIG